ncbi:MAG: formylglycine-generating enzyme family protein [Ottowia sp.]|nr:formylglycine-generating enzyme family protein [Ottowia sp.]
MGDQLEKWTNSIGMEFVKIPGGFYMRCGDPSWEVCASDEQPQCLISISSFWMAVYEVTQAQWEKVMGVGSNPSKFKGWNNPVEQVNWDEVQEFVRRLSAQEGRSYRLPTEAEWEYAARAGSQTAYCFGDKEGDLGDYAWYRDNSDGRTHPVGEKLPNAWGLYDMYGNVWEWVADWYDGNYYASSSDTDNPHGPSAGTQRVVRGGCWNIGAGNCRSANRAKGSPGIRDNDRGFRLALSLVN